MWWRWFPWKFLLRSAAQQQGFLDPIKLFSQLQNFAQPSEVTAPTELLRSGVILHARGLINSLAIQHNLDWVWPYWVECQYNPRNKAFIPRAFSLTQINLTHRNWTAVGLPDCAQYPIVDPRGLVTPIYNGWSIDAWILPLDEKPLLPSRLINVQQKLDFVDGLRVVTECTHENCTLRSIVKMDGAATDPVCRIEIYANAPGAGKVAISLRPYNPEGVIFIHDIALQKDRKGLLVNRKEHVYFDPPIEQCEFSYYHDGDVLRSLHSKTPSDHVWCKVGMATSAALYSIYGGVTRSITVQIPLGNHNAHNNSSSGHVSPHFLWKKNLQEESPLKIPDTYWQFLYEAAIRTMVLHCPKEVYPGPFIYRRFWFRDATFILYALLVAGFKERVRLALDQFRSRQTREGYFLSQEGEWDSNGEALWIMQQYCQMTDQPPPKAWKESIIKAGRWICKKRLPKTLKFKHAGLLPSGFSAEHLGPNDFYYWDDFWAVAGLNAAAFLCEAYKDQDLSIRFKNEAESLSLTIDQSLLKVAQRLQRAAMPASVYRRMDTGAIGSLVAGHPLRLIKPDDPRLKDTLNFLMQHCLIKGGFFHDMTHSGINPYLTLHIAQALLRAEDPRFLDLMSTVANLASSTGQWPEAIHPATGGGCMGDGQHVWAAAEWVLMIRNCFIREENDRLILCSGIPRSWFEKGKNISFGPAPTSFGNVEITLTPGPSNVIVSWTGHWYAREPLIEVKILNSKVVTVPQGTHTITLEWTGHP